jgi:MFS family permease
VLSAIVPISSLVLGISILLAGNGLLAIALGLRADYEAFGETIVGVVMGAYFIGFVAGTYLCPALIRKVGHIRTFAALAAIASVTAVAYGVLVDPLLWLPLRAISGFCLVGIYMVVESWLNAQTPNDQRGRVFAAYMTVTLLALAVGLYLARVAGETGKWQPFVWASLLFTLGLVPVTLTRVREPAAVEQPEPMFARMFRISPFGTSGVFIAGVINGAFWGLAPLYFASTGLDTDRTALFMALVILGGALLQGPVGHFSDRHDRRKVLIIVAFVGCAAALLALLAIDHSRLALGACAFVYGGMMLGAYSLGVAHVNDHLDPPQVLGATGTLLLLYGMGAAIGPMAAGMLMQYLGNGALPVMSGTALGLLGLYGLRRMLVGAPIPVQEQAPFVTMVRTSQAALEMYPEAESTGPAERP